ncbi:MAG: hypothetical protein AB7G25_14860 [Sphingomonadaceae bacterium]
MTSRSLALRHAFMLRFVSVTAHALGKLVVIGQKREATKAFGQLVRGQRFGFDCLFHADNYCRTG